MGKLNNKNVNTEKNEEGGNEEPYALGYWRGVGVIVLTKCNILITYNMQSLGYIPVQCT